MRNDKSYIITVLGQHCNKCKL